MGEALGVEPTASMKEVSLLDVPLGQYRRRGMAVLWLSHVEGELALVIAGGHATVGLFVGAN